MAVEISPTIIPYGLYYDKTYLLYLLWTCSRPEYAWNICHWTLSNQQSINLFSKLTIHFVFKSDIKRVMGLWLSSTTKFDMSHEESIILSQKPFWQNVRQVPFRFCWMAFQKLSDFNAYLAMFHMSDDNSRWLSPNHLDFSDYVTTCTNKFQLCFDFDNFQMSSARVMGFFC